ncbi:MAG: hypothetical protein RR651_02785 [Lysinibacillus sp.]
MENNNQITANQTSTSVQSVERALMLLKLVGESSSPIAVKDLLGG